MTPTERIIASMIAALAMSGVLIAVFFVVLLVLSL